MAQERIEYLFAAQVQGQREMQQLVASVDKLRQEVDALKAANGGLAASTDAVIRNGKRYNNALDAQAKELRNARQGTQQLGMQVNDFFTSVSTGASPVQAFNQQIGQLGYAMSMMGGTAGAIGSFLAGPWGAAILVATMALGPFIESLFDVSEATKQAEEAAKKMDSAVEARMQSEYNLRLALADTAKEYRQIRLEMMANAAQAVKTASVELNARLKVLNALQAEQEGLEKQAAGAGGLRAQAEMTTGQVLDRARVGGGIKNSITAVKAQITALEGATAKLNAATIDVVQAQAKIDKGAGKSKTPKKDNEDQIEVNKSLGDYLKLLEQGSKPLTEYQKGIYDLQSAYGALAPEEQKRYAMQQDLAILQQDILQGERDNAKAIEQVGQIIAKATEAPTPAMDAILARSEELRSSFESIGNAVSDAFKGMLTGATSFKDGMRGIINSVISELWRLYVVQQIVGFVTKAIGGITGVTLPGRAVGGSVNSNKPYMVGEKGPELFIPRGNGTIIPNHNMKGGGGANGINITVDARGSSDPAAVRAQVQQGILEAAPAIIAAAEARTNRGLRRPRLAGVMQ